MTPIEHNEQLSRGARMMYLAGYFDGEGCITVHSGLRLLVTAAYPLSLLNLQKTFGGTVVARGAPKKVTHKQLYEWTLFGQKAYNALKALFPYLTEKKDQASMAMNWYDYPHPDKQEKDAADERARFADELKRLKHVSWTIDGQAVTEEPDNDDDDQLHLPFYKEAPVTV